MCRVEVFPQTRRATESAIQQPGLIRVSAGGRLFSFSLHPPIGAEFAELGCGAGAVRFAALNLTLRVGLAQGVLVNAVFVGPGGRVDAKGGKQAFAAADLGRIVAAAAVMKIQEIIFS